MKIRLIDFGVSKEHCPFRPHENDAGADVYVPFDCTLNPGDIIKIPLGFGLEIPDGYAGYVFPSPADNQEGYPDWPAGHHPCDYCRFCTGSRQGTWHRSLWQYWKINFYRQRRRIYRHLNTKQYTMHREENYYYDHFWRKN